MKLIVTTNGRLFKNSSGEYYTGIVYEYDFFRRYFDVFEEIRLVAHVEYKEDISNMMRVDGPGLEVFEVPFPHGKLDYIMKYSAIARQLKRSINGCDAAVLRIPDQLAFQLFPILKKNHIPIGVEVTSNSWEFFEKGAMKSFLRPILRRLWDFQQKNACREADATSYVTKYAIQKRYPPSNKKNTFTTSCSSVDTGFCKPGKKDFGVQPLKNLSCLHVSGSISGKAKGHKELVEAAVILKKKGRTLEINWVGSGKLDDDIEGLITAHALKVTRLGKRSHDEVAGLMNEKDLFVFPSYREGLPRVVVEAMANGMPCVGTNIAGIAELLDRDMLVPVRDSAALAGKIEYLADNPKQLTLQSERNINTAAEYTPSVLSEKRKEFYRFIRKLAIERDENKDQISE